MVGIEPDCFVVVSHGLVVFAFVVPQEATVAVGKCVVVIEPDCLFVIGHRLLVVVLPLPH